MHVSNVMMHAWLVMHQATQDRCDSHCLIPGRGGVALTDLLDRTCACSIYFVPIGCVQSTQHCGNAAERLMENHEMLRARVRARSDEVARETESGEGGGEDTAEICPE